MLTSACIHKLQSQNTKNICNICKTIDENTFILVKYRQISHLIFCLIFCIIFLKYVKFCKPKNKIETIPKNEVVQK